MNEVTIAVVSVVVIVGSLYLIIKASRTHTGGEINKLHEDIHVGIGKIDSMTEELRRINSTFEFKGKK